MIWGGEGRGDETIPASLCGDTEIGRIFRSRLTGSNVAFPGSIARGRL